MAVILASTKDLTGRVFGRLTVVEPADTGRWTCRCECGNATTVHASNLKQGRTRSCGCFNREFQRAQRLTHGMYGTRFYGIWSSMMTRCTNSNCRAYSDYGGRGISVCSDWNTFDGFMRDMHESYLAAGEAVGEKNATLDRIDANDGYHPGNCRWATRLEQNSNRRNSRLLRLGTEERTVPQWARIYGIRPGLVYDRLGRGWSLERALTQHVREV